MLTGDMLIGAAAVRGRGDAFRATDPASGHEVELLFPLGGFAHQMLPSLLYALVADTFERQDVATATGFGGMAGYLGGTIFSLVIGQLAAAIGFEPLFVCLSVFDIAAFVVVWLVLGERGARAGAGQRLAGAD